MLIYKIFNPAASTTEYVCDSQTTIDARPTTIELNQCSIGGQSQANTFLTSYQSAWLNQQFNLFTVNLQTTVDGGVVWTVIDLNTQPQNTDYQYFVLDPTTGTYAEAIGLDAAKALFGQTQQNYLVFTNMNQYTTMTSWT
jgi:hypothetical protein